MTVPDPVCPVPPAVVSRLAARAWAANRGSPPWESDSLAARTRLTYIGSTVTVLTGLYAEGYTVIDSAALDRLLYFAGLKPETPEGDHTP